QTRYATDVTDLRDFLRALIPQTPQATDVTDLTDSRTAGHDHRAACASCALCRRTGTGGSLQGPPGRPVPARLRVLRRRHRRSEIASALERYRRGADAQLPESVSSRPGAASPP